MLNEFAGKIENAESVQEYEQVLKELNQYLKHQGLQDEALILDGIAGLRKNRFSSREEKEDFEAKKKVALNFCKTLETEMTTGGSDRIITVLENFSSFCRSLYKSRVHEKCSNGIKTHLTGIRIENEYDLQKLMISALSVVFSDVRTEVLQDSGHHAVRKDIVIDSEESVIELKCTRPGMTERQLSEEIAADIIHYEYKKLYFYIYDKEEIIQNIVSFQQSYENKNVSAKKVRVIIYNHADI